MYVLTSVLTFIFPLSTFFKNLVVGCVVIQMTFLSMKSDKKRRTIHPLWTCVTRIIGKKSFSQYMLGSPFSTNRAKAVLKASLAPPTNNASLLFWLVQFLAAKQIVGGNNLPCGFLAPSVGFWRDFQHVLRTLPM